MLKVAAAYLVTLVVMVALDLLWLGVVAKGTYQQGIGHLMAERPDVMVATAFYAVYALGLMVFAVQPNAAIGAGRTAIAAAMFGFFAYATYDLTNLATLRNWPIGVSLLDIGWGVVVSTASASAGRFAFDHIS